MTRKQLAEFILRKRNEIGLSQKELAKRIGRLRQAIFEIENDLVDFKISTVLDIISVLGYDITLIEKKSDHKYDFSKIKPSLSESFHKTKKIKNEKSNRRPRK
jgi:DNA-binding XRE family transcriptional regulator